MLCYEQERGCCVKNHYNGSAGFFYIINSYTDSD